MGVSDFGSATLDLVQVHGLDYNECLWRLDINNELGNNRNYFHQHTFE